MGRRRKSEMDGEDTVTETVEETVAVPVEDAPVTMDVPVTVPEPEPEPKQESGGNPSVSKDLAHLFKSAAKTGVPTLITYKPAGSSTLKHVLVDINISAIESGWLTYKAAVPNASPEKYLLKVYEITHSEIPRLYRAVATISLS
jgi:hypothetical protein